MQLFSNFCLLIKNFKWDICNIFPHRIRTTSAWKNLRRYSSHGNQKYRHAWQHLVFHTNILLFTLCYIEFKFYCLTEYCWVVYQVPNLLTKPAWLRLVLMIRSCELRTPFYKHQILYGNKNIINNSAAQNQQNNNS